jgi:hypothetical protein
LIADCLAQTLAALLGHAARGHARGQPPRLKHEHITRPACVEHGGRHARRLARARRRFDDE